MGFLKFFFETINFHRVLRQLVTSCSNMEKHIVLELQGDVLLLLM